MYIVYQKFSCNNTTVHTNFVGGYTERTDRDADRNTDRHRQSHLWENSNNVFYNSGLTGSMFAAKRFIMMDKALHQRYYCNKEMKLHTTFWLLCAVSFLL